MEYPLAVIPMLPVTLQMVTPDRVDFGLKNNIEKINV
jgi:hypothetical protein